MNETQNQTDLKGAASGNELNGRMTIAYVASSAPFKFDKSLDDRKGEPIYDHSR